MVVVPEVPKAVCRDQLVVSQQPELVSFGWMNATPASESQVALQQAWTLQVEKALALLLIQHQHSVSTLQTQRNEEGKPPAFIAAGRELDAGLIAATQAAAHQPTQRQLMLPLSGIRAEQMLQLLMGLNFQHRTTLRSLLIRNGST